MKILFSPSEGKNKGEILECQQMSLESFCFSCKMREKVIKSYLEALRGNEREIFKIFGSKKIELETLVFCQNLYYSTLFRAIELYDGVAYQALDFKGLDEEAKKFILEHVYIFSNLFGVVCASDKLPFYKLNQNYKHRDFGVQSIFKIMERDLDNFFKHDEIIDLRAEVYIKAYELKIPHVSVKFLKNGKNVSHYAKYYRGILLRELAKTKGVIDKILRIENLVLQDIVYKGLTRVYIYNLEE